MQKERFLFLLTVLILITLLLRDLPYFNVLIVNRIWIIYLLILLLLILSGMKFKVRHVSYAVLLLFIGAFILALLGLTFFAEGVGAVLYFALWIVFIHGIYSFLKESH